MFIRILGNGGAINDGLPYNAFIIDDKYLIEAPPDIMQGLYREDIDLSDIKIIYISHFHGDHFFGLPFLILRLFFNSVSKPLSGKITIIGPHNVKNRAREIYGLAFGENHPVINWVNDNILFAELNSGQEIFFDNEALIKIFPMNHPVETWGFSLYLQNKIVFSYFADTLWDDGLISQIKLSPEIILADLNGEHSDPAKVHLSEDDIIAKALPFCGENTVFYGTHLRYQKESAHPKIRYARPGDVIELLR